MRKDIVEHFKKNDSLLYSAIKSEELKLTKSNNYFKTIVRSIIGQQLSLYAARSIFNRFELLVGEDIQPTSIIETPIDKLRTAGLSLRKAEYLQSLAAEVLGNRISLDALEEKDDEQVIRELIRLKGVGNWTAEMFLMFALAREDVFSHNDIGLRNAVLRIYKLEQYEFEVFENISSKWKPYRSYASLVLWSYLENTPLKLNILK